MKRNIMMVLTAMTLFSGPAFAGEIEDKLDKGYKEATPVDKIVMLAVVKNDIKDWKERQRVQRMVDSVFSGEVLKGKSSEEKLSLLGGMRKAVAAKIKETNKERRAAKKKTLWTLEPSNDWQAAIAMSYVVDTAGPAPTIEKLACLKTVRENTASFSHSTLAMSLLTDALLRNKEYIEADHAGKLEILRILTDDKKTMGSSERQVFEKAVITDWINTQIKGGKGPADLLIALKDLKDSNKLQYFSYTWGRTLLENMAKVR